MDRAFVIECAVFSGRRFAFINYDRPLLWGWVAAHAAPTPHNFISKPMKFRAALNEAMEATRTVAGSTKP
jgi:hypothetical protein